MRRGEDTLMPNWALEAIDRLTLAADIRVLNYLTRYRLYRDNTYSNKQLAIALEIDLRTVQASTKRLAEKGLIVSDDETNCSREAASIAQTVRKHLAKTLQKDSRKNEMKGVQDDKNSPLNKGIKEERKLKPKQEEGDDLNTPALAAALAQTLETQNDRARARTANAVDSDLPNPDQVQKQGQAGQKTGMPNVGFERAAPLSASPAALRLFMGLFLNHSDGQHFCQKYAQRLDRWHEAYGEEFIKLAWELSPSVPGVNRRYQALAWLLDEERKWPDELTSKYVQVVERRCQPVVVAPNIDRGVKPGDRLRFLDGETVNVLHLDRAQVVTDSENDERGYVQFAALGKSVEVLRS